MSDLLTRFVVALEKIADGLTGAKVAVAQPSKDDSKAPTTNTKTATDDAKKADAAKQAAAKAAADKAAADKAAADKAAATSGGKGAAGAPAGTTKSPGGKRSLDDVRNMIRKVATTEGLGKPDAVNILEEEGGVKSVAELKPENYDKVYEACEVAISALAKKDGAPGDDMGDLM